MPQTESPIVLRLDGNIVQPDIHVAQAGSTLSVDFTSTADASTQAYVVHVPIADYELDRDTVLRRDGEKTDLGDIPSLLHTIRDRSPLQLTLKPDSFYDVLAVHEKKMVPTRVVTAEGPVPDGAIADEFKIMIALKLGLFPDDLKGVAAHFIANTSIGYNREQLAYFGLRVDDIVATIVREELFDVLFTDMRSIYADKTTEQIRKYLLSRKVRRA